ncbi:MAG TPA: mercuric transporter MerT family protein [Gammaproteobacteria bacterium]|nr:mercuric transporter MerT family protein [Gammaproteobacteria bacterium]
MSKPFDQALTGDKALRAEGDDKAARKVFVTIVGSIIAALAASSCCVIPLVLFTLGVSGAWIANLTALAPYQPLFVVLTLAFLAWGFWMVYRKPKIVCAEGYCARPISDRIAKTGLWVATVLITIALAFPYVAPLFGA